ncbi:AI-2E family transporter [Candidatus Peregrinibacteria bacterium]|nr:AI-2E family transporter [Candidatus Peregrinibacteria bacterium]
MITVQAGIKYFFFIVLGYLFFLIIQPFLPAIVLALVFAIGFSPLLTMLQTKAKCNKTLATTGVFIITIIFIITPLALLLGLIAKQAIIFATGPDLQALMKFVNEFESITVFDITINLETIKSSLLGALGSIGETATILGSEIFGRLLNISFQFFVFLFLYFFLLLDGKEFTTYLKKIFPFSKKQNTIFFQRFSHVARTVFRGNLLAALLSGIAAIMAFELFGLQAALIWGILAGILSLIPTIGTLVIYGIASIILSFGTEFPWMLAPLLYFLIMEIGLIQSVIKPKLIDDKMKIHPVLVFLALVGGVSVFGSIGIIYGPLIVVLFITMFDFIVVTENK